MTTAKQKLRTVNVAKKKEIEVKKATPQGTPPNSTVVSPKNENCSRAAQFQGLPKVLKSTTPEAMPYGATRTEADHNNNMTRRAFQPSKGLPAQSSHETHLKHHIAPFALVELPAGTAQTRTDTAESHAVDTVAIDSSGVERAKTENETCRSAAMHAGLRAPANGRMRKSLQRNSLEEDFDWVFDDDPFQDE